jgi:hypothetical protein
MDQSTLVNGGQALVSALDAEGFSPRLAMWVHHADTDTWKLWLVPPRGKIDKADFYRRIAKIVSAHRNELGGVDASDTEMMADDHVAVQGLGKFLRLQGIGNVHFSGNRFNGFYVPDGIILRSDL